ncbi:MAG: universal stress protein [Myxococcota bacterium]
MKILVGVDGSSREPKVLDEAINLAKDRGGTLTLARAMTIPLSVPTTLWTMQGDDLTKFLVEHGNRELEKSAERIPSSLRGGIVTRMGQPADTLVALAEELEADMVVIGSHGYGGVDRLLGTTAAKVVNRAGCSVLVVR